MFHRRPSPQRAALTILASAAFLCLLFAPSKDEATGRLVFDWRPEIEPLLLLAGLALLALAGRRLPTPVRWIVAALVFALALLQLADAVVLGIFDRELDLYFDLPHVPKLLAMLYDAAGPWRGGTIIAAALLVSAGLVALIGRTLAASEHVLKPPRHANLCLGIIAAALIAAPMAGLHLGTMPLAEHTLPVLAGQGTRLYRDFVVMHGDDHRYAAALASPQPEPRALPGLKRRDVSLVFVESYGTLALDDPRFSPAVRPALEEFAAATRQAGYHLASSRIASPTYGGGSWLAHDTLDSGLRLDPLLGRLVTRTDRRSLPAYMKSAGYRTVDIAPGIKTPEPDHGFWRFDRSYYGADLGYQGPSFGWFGIPDQYTLRHFDETEAAPGHKPLFAQIVLVSSHTPYTPLPPYVADWQEGDLYRGIDRASWNRSYAPPDWSHLEGAYAASIVYDLRTLAGWLQNRRDDGLVVILGDHQPPGFASGAAQPWTVPIHMLSRDPDLLRPFLARGYAEGAMPPQSGVFGGMEGFLAEFLAAYAQPPTVAAAPPDKTERVAE